jgi:DNA (cytosine-5)-methyltransferase 1
MSRAELVSLSHFRARFFNWATEEHGSNPQFLDWAGKSRSTDFRTAFNRYFQWLWSEATNEWIDPKQAIRSHPIWKEADPDGKWLTAIPKQESALSKTIVTPYVYHCFKKMYFGGQLEAEGISDPKVQAAYDARKQALGFAMEREDNFQQYSPSSTQPSQAIKVGDIIGVTRDLETDWQSKSTIWYRMWNFSDSSNAN